MIFPSNKWWLLILVFPIFPNTECKIEQLINCGEEMCYREKETPNQQQKYLPTLSGSDYCYCDENCTVFGDCCWDKAIYPNDKRGESPWKCVQLTLNQSVYASVSCEHESGGLDQSGGKNVAENEYNYMMEIPMYLCGTRIYYANIFCAYCNHQESFLKYPWLYVKCTANITIEMLLEHGQYQIVWRHWRGGKALCSLSQYAKVKNGRQSVFSVSNCPPNSDPQVSANCKAYSFISYDSEKVHRNPCTLCNLSITSDLGCAVAQKTDPSTQKYTFTTDFMWRFDKCKVFWSIWDKLNHKCKFVNCTCGLNCSIDSCNNSEQNHLTNKILKNFTVKKINKYIICIGLSVSIVCLLLHMFISIFSSLPNNSSTKMFDTLSFCMLLGQMLFMYDLFPFIDLPDLICYLLGIMIQFFNIASFFWMNAFSIDIYYTFSNASLKYTSAKKHYRFALYAWLSAALVTAAPVLADFTDLLPCEYRPYLAAKKDVCWFGSHKAMIIFFYVPALFLVLLNLIMFLNTACWLQKQQRSSEVLKTSGKKEYNRLWLYMKLSTIMGLCHVFGLIKLLTNNEVYHYLFHLFITLQGAFIFIMFDLKIDGNWVFLRFRRLQQERNTGNHNQVTVASLVRQSRDSVICPV